MIDRKRIDEFFDFWSEVAKKNPKLEFGNGSAANLIYNQLVHLGEEPSEGNDKYNSNIDPSGRVGNKAFENLVEYYLNDEFLKVFVLKSHPSFCIFKSKGQQIDNASQHIKMYIPLDGDHIEKGSQMIFDYISKNRMVSTSKINRKVRFDDVVVRLVEPENFVQLMNFIDTNEYIQEGLLKPNPFAFNYHGIALACDGVGSESFNGILCALIDMFIGYCKDNKMIDNMNSYNFYKYVTYLYNSEFIYKTDSKIREYYFGVGNGSYDKEIDLFKQIIQSITEYSNEDYNISDYLEFYKKCNYKELTLEETVEMLKITIEKLSLKYSIEKKMTLAESDSLAIHQISAYLNLGEKKFITKDYNLRNILVNSNFRDNMNFMMMSSNQSRLVDFLREININLEETRVKI